MSNAILGAVPLKALKSKPVNSNEQILWPHIGLQTRKIAR